VKVTEPRGIRFALAIVADARMTADIGFIFTLKADGHVLTDESMEAFLLSSRPLTY
jgi:hypothetical protein